MRSDLELLREYTREKSEAAFATLVNRHLDLVYSAALRQVRSPELAEEVVQSVFTDLARQAHVLAPRTILTAWLYQVTRRTAIDAVRREVRRQQREQTALEMNTINAAPDTWTQIEPLLDEAMEALDDTDRSAVLLRYFENKSLRQVGQTLGTSDDAAQKRVSRALERLREFLGKRGVTASAGALGTLISAHAVQAAPARLAIALASLGSAAMLSLPAATGPGATTAPLGAVRQISRAELAAGLVTVAGIGLITWIALHPPEHAGRRAAEDSGRPKTEQNQLAAARAPGDTPDVNEPPRDPDPLALLRAVARARQRVVSGSMALDVTTENFRSGRTEKNQLTVSALFDGAKLRVEQVGREYAYKYSENEAEQAEIARRADSMSREEAARAGLLTGFEARYVTAFDGAAQLQYRESHGRPDGTTINEPGGGLSAYCFDPRCLGLQALPSIGSTVENALGYSGAKSVTLMGRESVEGVPAWHVQVLSQHDDLLDFWIEVARPERVLKQAYRNNVVLSKYADARTGSAIPVEVTAVLSQPTGPFTTKFVRTSAQFNGPVEPAAFTLAGLGMEIGTPVSDIRIHRTIGYWTGTGLSEWVPLKPGKVADSQSSPQLTELLNLLESAPSSPEALEAAQWILLNTPDGPEVEKAADLIMREHSRDTNLVNLCQELERVRHRSSRPLLEAILKDNPSVNVRATACFTLATLLKDDAQYGQNKQATREAEALYERLLTEFGQVLLHRGRGAELARPQLSELRRLIVGKPAPEIDGVDLEGEPLKLTDYRGRVVVLVFWSSGYTEAPDHRKLVERMAGKLFAFLGVYADDDLAKAKAVVEKYRIPWPSFRDSREGPISQTWHVRSWPNLWVLDRQGVIRYRGLRGRELTDAVDTLLRE